MCVCCVVMERRSKSKHGLRESGKKQYVEHPLVPCCEHIVRACRVCVSFSTTQSATNPCFPLFFTIHNNTFMTSNFSSSVRCSSQKKEHEGVTTTMMHDEDPFADILGSPPPAWIRIGVFGAPESGKEFLVTSISQWSSSSYSSSSSTAVSATTHTAGGGTNSKMGGGGGVESASLVEVDAALCLCNACCSTSGPTVSNDAAACSPPLKQIQTASIAFLKDAAQTLHQRGVFATKLVHPTRALVRISVPTAAPQPHDSSAGVTAKEGSSDEPKSDVCSKDDGYLLSSSTSTLAARTKAVTQIDLEVVNCWSFDPHHAADVLDEALGDDPGSAPASPSGHGDVVIRDEDLVSCDVFLIVFDVTSRDTFHVCRRIAASLKRIFASSSVRGGNSSNSNSSNKAVIAVVASSHHTTKSKRVVSHEECRALGTHLGVPIFDFSVVPSDMGRQRRALEKLISRALRLRQGL